MGGWIGGMGPMPSSEGDFNLADISDYQQGFTVSWKTGTSVEISSGKFVSDGLLIETGIAHTHTMTSLVVPFGRHYVYLDKSASTRYVPVFYDSTVVPLYAQADGGWYHPTNLGDRVVGVAISGAGAAIIPYFDAVCHGSGLIRYVMPRYMAQLASAMSPSGAWQTPDDYESSVIVPVNAVEIYLQISNTDPSQSVGVYAATSEWAAQHTTLDDAALAGWGYNNLTTARWIPLGPSRNVKLGGLAWNDNAMGLFVSGFGYLTR